jgi:HEPN domain-containing protein
LAKAKIDLRGAELDLAAAPPLIEDALFHCQQAAEKSFKAFLAFHNQIIRRTHNIEEVGEACSRLDPSLRPLVDEAVTLSEYAWAFRYPGPLSVPTLDEARTTFTVARRVNEAIYERTPREAHP